MEDNNLHGLQLCFAYEDECIRLCCEGESRNAGLESQGPNSKSRPS